MHGFNGFKDWGNFDLIARQFTNEGFTFIKFNSSHNGTTYANPEEFDDLDAYSQNNYSKELFDLGVIVDWVSSEENPYKDFIDNRNICLIGHSRGGGVAILHAAKDKRIKALATWASVSECKTPWGNWDDEKLSEWKKSGTVHILNSRTKQQMPLNYQLFLDYVENAEAFNLAAAIGSLTIPVLVCHGTKDEAVPVDKAHQLKNGSKNAKLFLVESDHVFGRKHPWESDHLPGAMQAVVNETIAFFKLHLYNKTH
ncbi:MAG: alpha/beta fold hydrolase [Chitinophagaceae bacterium]|nr:alpha/beta fold hydrolase [Chitinophagaceae bacterium]